MFLKIFRAMVLRSRTCETHLGVFIPAHGQTFPKAVGSVEAGLEQGIFITFPSDLYMQPVLKPVSRQVNPREGFEQVVSGAMPVGNSVNEDPAQTRLNNAPIPKTLGFSTRNLYMLCYFEKDFSLLLMSFIMTSFTCVPICFWRKIS